MFVGTFGHLSDHSGPIPQRAGLLGRVSSALSGISRAFQPDPLQAIDSRMARDIGFEFAPARPVPLPPSVYGHV